jgi:hypothetical protein
VDNFPPIAKLSTVTPELPVPTNVMLEFTLTLSEDIVIPGYPASSVPITVTNGVATNPVFRTVYTASEMVFNVTATAQGLVTVTVAASAVADRNSNRNVVASNTLRVLFDTAAPTVLISPQVPYYAKHSTRRPDGAWEVLLRISELPRSFSLSMFNSTNSVLSAFQRRRDLDTAGVVMYSLLVRPLADGPINISLPATRFRDLADNRNALSTSRFVFDSARPVALITSSHPPISNASNILFTFYSNEDLNDWSAASPVVTNGAVHTLTLLNVTEGPWEGQRRQYYSFYVYIGADATVTVNLPEGRVSDLALNPCYALPTLTFVIDATPPGAVLTTTTRPVTNTPEVFNVAFTEVPFGLTADSVACYNCTVRGLVMVGPVPATSHTDVFAANPPVTYSFTIVPALPECDVLVFLRAGSYYDRAFNPSVAHSNGIRFHYDGIPPTVTLRTDTPFNADQTSVGPVFVRFSEPIVEFTPSHLRVRMGRAMHVEEANDSISDHFVVDVQPNVPGPALLSDVRVSVEEGKVFDPAGNGNVLSYLATVGAAERVLRFQYHFAPPPKFNFVPIVLLVVGLIAGGLAIIAYCVYMHYRIRWEMEHGIYRDPLMTLKAKTSGGTKALRRNLTFLQTYPTPYVVAIAPPDPDVELGEGGGAAAGAAAAGPKGKAKGSAPAKGRGGKTAGGKKRGGAAGARGGAGAAAGTAAARGRKKPGTAAAAAGVGRGRGGGGAAGKASKPRAGAAAGPAATPK